jgi:hypothetical protein
MLRHLEHIGARLRGRSIGSDLIMLLARRRIWPLAVETAAQERPSGSPSEALCSCRNDPWTPDFFVRPVDSNINSLAWIMSSKNISEHRSLPMRLNTRNNHALHRRPNHQDHSSSAFILLTTERAKPSLLSLFSLTEPRSRLKPQLKATWLHSCT